MRRAGLGQATGMQDVATDGTPLVDVLVDWQRETRRLVRQVPVGDHPEGVLPSDELAERSEALRRLRRTLLPRETRKQRFVWPLIESCLDDGVRLLDEIKSRKRLFEQEMIMMRWADERSRAFDGRVETFLDEVGEYVSFEQRLLPRIATEIPGAAQRDAAERLLNDRTLYPVAPHPDLPATPLAAVLIGPVAGVVDRLRDRFTTAPG